MGELLAAVVTIAVIVLGLAVVVGKLSPEDALLRVGVFVFIICLAPAIAVCFKVALVALKPLLLLVALLVVVTVFVKALLTMKS
jgi:hypothetical protein